MTTLIAVCGHTPQIVTETLWGLAQRGIFPEQAIILTTSDGKPDIEKQLLGKDGKIQSLAELLKATPPEVNIWVSSSVDILTERDTDEFFALAMKAAQKATEAEDAQTFFSVGGGRKTMSVVLAFAAQCYARKNDEILHTLVSADCESSQFFYPTLDAGSENGRVQLVSIPFFRMRGYLPPNYLLHASTKEIAEVLCGDPSIEIDLSNRTVCFAHAKATLPPAFFALYLFFLSLRDCPAEAGKCCPKECTRCSRTVGEIVENAEIIFQTYCLLPKSGRSKAGRGIEHLSNINFLSYRRRLEELLVKAFGELGKKFSIVRIGQRRNARYCLRLPYKAVTFSNEDASAILRILSK